MERNIFSGVEEKSEHGKRILKPHLQRHSQQLMMVVGVAPSLATLTGGELCDGLGSFRDSVLGELTGEDEADGSLDFARSNGRLLVVAGQVLGLDGNLVKDILQS